MKLTGRRWFIALMIVAAMSSWMPAGATAAEEAVSILGMAWTPDPAPALVVSASGPLAFVERRPQPGVLLLELPGARSPELLAPVSRPEAGLQSAVLATAGGVSLRVEHDPGLIVAVAALPAGIEVRLIDPSARAHDLTDLLAIADDAGVSVMLSAAGPLVGKVFTLDNPPRVVVDLPGVVNRVAKRAHMVDAAGVRRVRVSQFATAPEPVARVVVDLDEAVSYRLESSARGAVLRVGARAVAASLPPAPAEAVVLAAAPLEAPPLEAMPVEVAALSEPVPVVPAAPPQMQVEAPSRSSSLTAAPDAAPAPVRSPVAAATTAEAPWTTNRAAMVEQAPPIQISAASTREVESEQRRFTGEPITLELKDADVKDVLRTFAKITGLNIVIDPEVTGSVTVQLESVPWDQALDIILRLNRLDYIVENNVLRVARIDRLTQEKSQVAEYRRQEESAKPMRTVTKTLSYITAGEASGILQSKDFLLSDRGAVVVDARNNQLIIRDNVDRLEGVLTLLDQMDTPVPQVIIEARIVETTRTFARDLGITWGFSGVGDALHGTTTGLQFPNTYEVGGGVNLGGAPGGPGFISLSFGDILNAFNLDFTLAAAEANGLAKIVSSPKVQAQENKPAMIQSGIQIPVQTVANNTVTIQYIDATLALNVTPQITSEGTVILQINLQKREPLPGINLANATNVPISIRSAQTNLMVRDGGTTVIGGIYQYTENETRNGVPFLADLPVVGNLFRSSTRSEKHDELLIFITPRIIKY